MKDLLFIGDERFEVVADEVVDESREDALEEDLEVTNFIG
tara:strand:- start:2142 stop:2261 length:120 start_codon:yes stop_codon:yes gene_type:complete